MSNKLRVCVVCGRTSVETRVSNWKLFNKTLCRKHYHHMVTYGKILKRTIYDDNEIMIYDKYAEILLYDRYGTEKARTKIDLDDVDRCSEYKWGTDSNNYPTTNSLGRLHRFIMKPPDGMVVDHINHDTLDNRKSNLRVCTRQENSFNIRKYNVNKTVGVYWYNKINKFRSKIQKDGKNIHLGYFKNRQDAIDARKQAELNFFGEYQNKGV